MTTEPFNPYASPAADSDSPPARNHGKVNRSDRAVNFVVDCTALTILFWMVGGVFFEYVAGPAPKIGWVEWYLTWNTLAWCTASFLYYFSLEAMTGCTVGKQLTETRVVDRFGRHPHLGQIAIRCLMRLIPLDPLTYLAGPEAQGLHDWSSGTRLVKFERKVHASD